MLCLNVQGVQLCDLDDLVPGFCDAESIIDVVRCVDTETSVPVDSAAIDSKTDEFPQESIAIADADLDCGGSRTERINRQRMEQVDTCFKFL